MSASSEPAPKGNLSFIAVARASDRVVLASCSHGANIDLSGVKTLLSPEQMEQVEVGTVYNSEVGSASWHLMADEKQLVYIATTSERYPNRHVFPLLDEVKRMFGAKCGDKARTARESALTSECRALFKKLLIKYDDVSQIDQLGRTLEKVEGVKMIMQENIEIALKNCVSLEAIDKQAEDLQAQAGVFKTRAKAVRNKMWWKLCKMRLMVAGVIIIILVVIIVPLVTMSQNK
ncbi:hypothetical protein CTAYLR_008742 [Chrysophaeum taylorii]|uniref:Uncharacterized protein n=1 Tax=Chrysophaeum taylorii TaxID=2483200 RepID=A0AAD7XNU9_9STRA|nr:hypothetical protein CTAYLR_008742 [Chrysophaeum taylorii]